MRNFRQPDMVSKCSSLILFEKNGILKSSSTYKLKMVTENDNMRLLKLLLLVVFGLSLSSPAGSATFVVENVFDDSDAEDTTPGDGVCADTFGTCTLRAAIMESNALASDDAIEFSTSGTITITPDLGPLPTITDFVIIDGQTAPGFNVSGTTLLSAPPVVTINGNLLAGSTIDGLRLNGNNAADSQLISLAIVNFPDNGIDIATNTDGIIIQGCNLSGNSGNGLFALNADFLVLGQIYGIFTQEFLGLGNLIANNGQAGVVISGSDNNTLFGNFIGMLADGVTPGGNSGNGISIIGNNNVIGFYDADERSGNIAANNSGAGISIAGSNNQLYANLIGLGSIAGFFGNNENGIELSGSENRIGHSADNARNEIANNQIGIRIGAGSQTIIENNHIGITTGALGNADDGIHINGGNQVQISNNQIINNGGNGIFANSDNNVIRGNHIGIAGNATFGNDEHGVFLFNAQDNIIGGSNPGDTNIIGDNGANSAPFFHGLQLQGDGHEITGNFIGITPNGIDVGQPATGLALAGIGFTVANNTIGYNNLGISVGGHSHTIEDNFIGTNASGRNAGNTFDGMRLEGNGAGFGNFIGINNLIAFNGRFGIYGNAIAGQTARYNIIGNQIIQNGNAGMALPFTGPNGSYLVQFNEVAYNGNNGIFVFGDTTTTTMTANTQYGNNGIAIDIDGGGLDNNDPGDNDLGPNKRMNHPQIISTLFTPGDPAMIRVDYSIDTTAANAAYPLTVQAYWTDREEAMQGRFFLTSVEYPNPQSIQSTDFELPAFFNGGGKIALMVSDDDGNSSELSPSATFGQIELLLRDGFETFNADF